MPSRKTTAIAPGARSAALPAVPAPGGEDDDPPLTARSVLASTLLGTDPPVLPVATLVKVAGLFGVNEGTARVALSRMAAAGEVEAVEGRYRLAGHLLARQARQRESRSPQLRRWKGAWALVVVTAVRRTATARADARRSLLAARLAELREGVWGRPDNLDVVVPTEIAGHVERWTAKPEGDPVALAAALWPLAEWAERAERLLDRLATTLPTLQPGHTEVLAPGFVLSAAVLRHFQADPLLPAELLPTDWPGDALRHDYDAWDAAYRRVLIGFHRGHVTPV